MLIKNLDYNYHPYSSLAHVPARPGHYIIFQQSPCLTFLKHNIYAYFSSRPPYPSPYVLPTFILFDFITQKKKIVSITNDRTPHKIFSSLLPRPPT